MPGESHVVVTGYSRSGSTMFYNMLRHAVDNFEFMDRGCTVLSLLNRAGDFVSKRPLDLFDLGKIADANVRNKDVYLIILIRDIRSVMTSRHIDVPDDYFLGYDHQYFISQDKQAYYLNPGIVETHNAICAAFEFGIFEKVLLVRYEDVVSSPADVQAKLGDALGFRYRAGFDSFHQAPIPEQLRAPMNEIRPVDERRVESWREDRHRARILSQFVRCPKLFDILIQYGYEPDRSWFEEFRAERVSSKSTAA